MALDLDPIATRTRRLDRTAAILTAFVLAVLEMGPAIAKKACGASDVEIAMISMGQSAGMLLTFLTAHLAARHAHVTLVFWPEVLARCVLIMTFFIQPGFALAWVAILAFAQMLQLMTMPARVTVYRHNYPQSLRGRIVSRNRQLQLLTTTLLALMLSESLEWCLGEGALFRLLGESPVDVVPMIRFLVPLMASVGILGSSIFRAIPEAEAPGGSQDNGAPVARTSIVETFRHFGRVWKQDARFRRYEIYFCIFGFANIMSIPLVQIHSIDALGADYRDMALINVVLVQGAVALTMPFWGKMLDRHSPLKLRGVLNLFIAAEYLGLMLAPTIGWVFLGRILRGVAVSGGSLVWMLGSLHFADRREDVPIYLGIHSCLTGMRWLAAPFLGVFLKSHFGDDARPVFLLSSIVIVVTAVLMLRDARREARED